MYHCSVKYCEPVSDYLEPYRPYMIQSGLGFPRAWITTDHRCIRTPSESADTLNYDTMYLKVLHRSLTWWYMKPYRKTVGLGFRTGLCSKTMAAISSYPKEGLLYSGPL